MRIELSYVTIYFLVLLPVSCTIWDQRDTKKAQLSVLEIASCIIERVDSLGVTNDYIYIGIFFSFLLTLIPTFCRLCEVRDLNGRGTHW